jgi:hypothetical protein
MKNLTLLLSMLLFGCYLFATPKSGSIKPIDFSATQSINIPTSNLNSKSLQYISNASKSKNVKPRGKVVILTNYKYIGLAFVLLGVCFLLVALLPWVAAGTLRACLTSITLGFVMVGIRYIVRPKNKKSKKEQGWFRRIFGDD